MLTPLILTLGLFFSSLTTTIHAYFIITQPGASASWANGSPYPVTWVKGREDGIDAFDIELMRLHTDGLYLVAKNVPSSYTSLNVFLQDVPAGDDYFLLCMNSTHGTTYAVSSRFTVTNSSSGNPKPVSAPTVTVSGTPDPLKLFATTLGPAANGVRGFLAGDERGVWGVLVVFGVTVVSGVWTLW
ncbi:hypothetical protein SCLCIDRAFT_1224358 [Scleroderma citrinum Foug A]|uniref:Yeast cell wall synthesis Kre9/Knh1-like N-terminal domain-containing protein n=1 Tax=Scleroderma citrinum Foug A TaxID=1036808 RepID=A0A0C2ZFH6_9AGAM|nr:hypothetical protein SCLCIDRAFT_1224358 [Scleroderma citrinum Foug A]